MTGLSTETLLSAYMEARDDYNYLQPLVSLSNHYRKTYVRRRRQFYIFLEKLHSSIAELEDKAQRYDALCG